MKYKGKELKEFTSEKPVVFDPPRKMLVWDNGIIDTPRLALATAYIPGRFYPVIGAATVYRHCAEIPEEPKPRRATNRELAKWLAQGKGEKVYYNKSLDEGVCFVATVCRYEVGDADIPVEDGYSVRKWDDEDWHEPTADYMGLED